MARPPPKEALICHSGESRNPGGAKPGYRVISPFHSFAAAGGDGAQGAGRIDRRGGREQGLLRGAGGCAGKGGLGRIYAANTLGAIAGVLFAVHIGLPVLDLKSLIVFGAALGSVLILKFTGTHWLSPGFVLVTIAVAAIAGLGVFGQRLRFYYRRAVQSMDERHLEPVLKRVLRHGAQLS